MWFKSLFFIGLFWILSNKVVAQTNSTPIQIDSTQKDAKAMKNTSARKASIYSAILPGLGQGYNKKYWKIPIIYAGLGGFAYLFYTNHQEYTYYRKNLLAETDSDPNTSNEIIGYDISGLQSEKLRYKKLRDFGIIGCSLVYVFNIIDANVDAHLKTFDVSDNLSMQFKPKLILTAYNEPAVGLGIKFKFKNK